MSLFYEMVMLQHDHFNKLSLLGQVHQLYLGFFFLTDGQFLKIKNQKSLVLGNDWPLFPVILIPSLPQ